MWKAFQRYRALDPATRALFWRALLLLPQVAMLLRLRGFNKTKDVLQAQRTTDSPTKLQPGQAPEVVAQTCRMIHAAAHYGWYHPTCLVESLALWHLLQKQGVPASLRIGVRRDTAKFEAHAWVEFAGQALNQASEPHRHYAAFDSGSTDPSGDQP